MENSHGDFFFQDPEDNRIQVRRAKIEEVEFFAENTARLAFETEGKVCDESRTVEFTSRGFQFPEKTSFWIASLEGKDVASMCLTTEFNVVKNKFYSWFQSVYIHNEHRGKKIFNTMFKCAEFFSRSQGHAGLKLYVERENLVARSVYLKKGFSFPNCEILESDLTFAFNSLEYSPEQFEQNFNTFLRLFEESKLRIPNFTIVNLSLSLLAEMGASEF